MTGPIRLLTAAAALAVFASPVSVRAQTVPAALVVTSPTLKHGEAVPRQHTPDGRNDSPALAWEGAPATTREFAVVCEDPDVGNPPPFVHWVIYKIPATAKGLPEALPINTTLPMPAELNGAVQGLNGFRRPLYRGPAPPPGKPHPYHFIVYALDTTLAPPQPGMPPMTRAELMDAMAGHIVGKGELVATYGRTSPSR